MTSRRGFTLVEVLVVLGVIAVLVAILIPAVQSARGAALRMSCASNLRQIGEAIANYESTYNIYPMGRFRYRILPYLDQQALYQLPYEQSNLRPGSPDWFRALDPYCPPIYRCPADSVPNGVDGETTANYLGNYGTWLPKDGFNGFFGMPGHDNPILPGQWVRPRDVLDGLSNTAMLSEVLRADGTYHRLRTGWTTPTGYSDLEEFVDTCQSIPRVPTDYGWRGSNLDLGLPWHNGGWASGLYNHASPPNRPSCKNGILFGSGLWTAASLHGGGVNVVFADGHLVFISESIDRHVWRDYGSRISPNVGL